MGGSPDQQPERCPVPHRLLSCCRSASVRFFVGRPMFTGTSHGLANDQKDQRCCRRRSRARRCRTLRVHRSAVRSLAAGARGRPATCVETAITSPSRKTQAQLLPDGRRPLGVGVADAPEVFGVAGIAPEVLEHRYAGSANPPVVIAHATCEQLERKVRVTEPEPPRRDGGAAGTRSAREPPVRRARPSPLRRARRGASAQAL